MNKKQKSLTNKGFSLVELIIVIAIMAVLVGVLAPQYLKYVKRSKVSTDIQNAEEIATAINVAISDGKAGSITGINNGTPTTAGTAVGGLDGFTAMPTSRCDSSYSWTVTWDATNGVTNITLGGTEIYPTNTAYHTAND